MTDKLTLIKDACEKALDVMEHDGVYHAEDLADKVLGIIGDPSRFAVIELPDKGDIPPGWDSGCLGAWYGPKGQAPVSAWPAEPYGPDTVAMPNGDFTTPADARALAAALIAAADAAEGKLVDWGSSR